MRMRILHFRLHRQLHGASREICRKLLSIYAIHHVISWSTEHHVMNHRVYSVKSRPRLANVSEVPTWELIATRISFSISLYASSFHCACVRVRIVTLHINKMKNEKKVEETVDISVDGRKRMNHSRRAKRYSFSLTGLLYYRCIAAGACTVR